jgi:hypothetical protein
MDIVEGMWIKEWKGDKNLMKVYINKKKGGRQLVNCELVEDRKHTILVRLSDGNEIVRKKKRDMPNEEE